MWNLCLGATIFLQTQDTTESSSQDLEQLPSSSSPSPSLSLPTSSSSLSTSSLPLPASSHLHQQRDGPERHGKRHDQQAVLQRVPQAESHNHIEQNGNDQNEDTDFWHNYIYNYEGLNDYDNDREHETEDYDEDGFLTHRIPEDELTFVDDAIQSHDHSFINVKSNKTSHYLNDSNTVVEEITTSYPTTNSAVSKLRNIQMIPKSEITFAEELSSRTDGPTSYMVQDEPDTSSSFDFDRILSHPDSMGISSDSRMENFFSKQTLLFVDALFDDFHFGQFGKAKCNVEKAERNRRQLKRLLHTCTRLYHVTDMNHFLSSYPDVKPLLDMTSYVTALLTILTDFTLSNSDCHILPYTQSTLFATEVLHGTQLVPSVGGVLRNLHVMILGHPDYFAGQSILDVYANRLPTPTIQSRRWFVEAMGVYLTLVQTGASAVLLTANNIHKKGKTDTIIQILKARLQLQGIHTASLIQNVDSSFVNHAWGHLDVFQAKRRMDLHVSLDVGVIDGGESHSMLSSKRTTKHPSHDHLSQEPKALAIRDRSQKTYHDTAEVKYDHKSQGGRENGSVRKRSERITRRPHARLERSLTSRRQLRQSRSVCGQAPLLETSSLTYIQGCQFISTRGGVLSLRCSAAERKMCDLAAGEGSVAMDDLLGWNKAERSVSWDITSKRKKCSRLPQTLTCVDTSWISTNDSSQTVCAVKLHVADGSTCLGIGVYFCNKDPCSDFNQGWIFGNEDCPSASRTGKEDTKSNLSGSRNFTSDSKTAHSHDSIRERSVWHGWSETGYEVDSHMVMPEFDGWLTGIRLYNKGGRLAISVKTSF